VTTCEYYSKVSFTLSDALFYAQLPMVLTPQSCYNLERNQRFHRDYDYDYSYLIEI